MLKNWIITGDTHGAVSERLENIIFENTNSNPRDTAVIILGDVGFNYYSDKRDWGLKRRASEYGFTLYCLRGNHEMRPSDVEGMKLVYDGDVKGEVYIEKEFPLIRYFVDGGEYEINGYKVLTIGGAYSVDKFYRLARGFHWFENEQLSDEEFEAIHKKVFGKTYDLVFTHAAPSSYEPTDLFLYSIDQTKVDKSTPIWLEKIKNDITCGIWCFGHYHADRVELPYVEQFFTDTEDLNDLVGRWIAYNKTGRLDNWIPVSPKMKGR